MKENKRKCEYDKCDNTFTGRANKKYCSKKCKQYNTISKRTDEAKEKNRLDKNERMRKYRAISRANEIHTNYNKNSPMKMSVL